MSNKRRILIIDDAKDLAEVLSITLTQQGFEVKVVSTGSEAIYLCGKETFDLLITDLNMPEMDGIQLIGSVRKIHPHQRIIVMTAHPWQWAPWNKRLISRHLEEEVIRSQEIKCLPKPFKKAQLFELIKDFFGGNGVSN
ncbi:response regulator [candidate division WOR-3 bacterium]|nr:response regulator [candidate division WOR-3 bacterium]